MWKTFYACRYPRLFFHIYAFFCDKSTSFLWKTMWKLWKFPSVDYAWAAGIADGFRPEEANECGKPKIPQSGLRKCKSRIFHVEEKTAFCLMWNIFITCSS